MPDDKTKPLVPAEGRLPLPVLVVEVVMVERFKLLADRAVTKPK